MIFLIDPGSFKKPCKTYVEPCTTLCLIFCPDVCKDVAYPLYGVPPDEA